MEITPIEAIIAGFAAAVAAITTSIKALIDVGQVKKWACFRHPCELGRVNDVDQIQNGNHKS